MSIYLNCPYAQKHVAKQHGARWDTARKQWYFHGDVLPDGLKQFTAQTQNSVKLGGQLWEECERCGAEPSYMQPGGHLCARCAQSDRPRIDTSCPAPYSRGIGQGFGSTEDGDL